MKYKLGICPECKVEENHSSRRRLYPCNLCGRWFCNKHIEPRLAYIPDFKVVIKDSTWRSLVEKEWNKRDGHPDFQYTKEKWYELKLEREIAWAKMEALLERTRVYGKPISPQKKQPRIVSTTAKTFSPEVGARPVEQRYGKCPRCSSSRLGALFFDGQKEKLRCQACGYEWEQPRIVAKKEEIRKDELKFKRQLLRERLKTLSISMILILVGLGIVLFEVLSPISIFLLYWFIIPIPLFAIGVLLLVIGIIGVIGASLSK